MNAVVAIFALRRLFIATVVALLCVYVGAGATNAGSFFSISVKTINLRPASVTEAGATLSEAGTLVDVSHTKQGALSDVVTISETFTRSDTRRPTRTDTGATVAEVNTLTRVAGTPSPSPAPSSFFTPTAAHAPTLALNPNPFSVKICSSDPCNPVVDGQSNAYNGSFFGGSLSANQLLIINAAQPPNAGNGVASAEDVVLGATSADPVHACSGCANFSSINLRNGAFSDFSAGDWQINVVNNSSSGAAPNFEMDFWQFSSQGTPITSGQAVSSSISGGCFTNNFAGSANGFGGNACTMGTAAFTPFSPNQLDPVELLQQNIPHDLDILNPCGQSVGGHGTYSYPAIASDATSLSTCPPDGEVLWLDLTDAQIEALSAPRWAKTLYHNLHQYGWMLLDRPGGSPPLYSSPQMVSDYSWTILGQPSQWTLMFQEIAAENGVSYASVFSNGQGNIMLPTGGVTLSHLHWLQFCPGASLGTFGSSPGTNSSCGTF